MDCSFELQFLWRKQQNSPEMRREREKEPTLWGEGDLRREVSDVLPARAQSVGGNPGWVTENRRAPPSSALVFLMVKP